MEGAAWLVIGLAAIFVVGFLVLRVWNRDSPLDRGEGGFYAADTRRQDDDDDIDIDGTGDGGGD